MATASVPRRAAGLIPLLTTFLVVLGVLSVHDIASGEVGSARLITHGAALAGLLFLLLLDRAERALPPTRFASAWDRHRGSGSGSGSEDDDGDSSLRTVA